MRNCIAILILFVITACTAEGEKTGFADLEELYNEFELKKELESKFETVQATRKGLLDSLELDLNVRLKNLEAQQKPPQDQVLQFQVRQQNYQQKSQQFEQELLQVQETYSGQIWEQIHQYVSDYGKENNYTYIHGTDGSGTMLYATEKKDITSALIQYINLTYKGK